MAAVEKRIPAKTEVRPLKGMQCVSLKQARTLCENIRALPKLNTRALNFLQDEGVSARTLAWLKDMSPEDRATLRIARNRVIDEVLAGNGREVDFMNRTIATGTIVAYPGSGQEMPALLECADAGGHTYALPTSEFEGRRGIALAMDEYELITHTTIKVTLIKPIGDPVVISYFPKKSTFMPLGSEGILGKPGEMRFICRNNDAWIGPVTRSSRTNSDKWMVYLVEFLSVKLRAMLEATISEKVHEAKAPKPELMVHKPPELVEVPKPQQARPLLDVPKLRERTRMSLYHTLQDSGTPYTVMEFARMFLERCARLGIPPNPEK